MNIRDEEMMVGEENVNPDLKECEICHEQSEGELYINKHPDNTEELSFFCNSCVSRIENI